MAETAVLFFLISTVVEFISLLVFIPIPSISYLLLSSGPVSTSNKTPATFFPFIKMSLGHFISGFKADSFLLYCFANANSRNHYKKI